MRCECGSRTEEGQEATSYTSKNFSRNGCNELSIASPPAQTAYVFREDYTVVVRPSGKEREEIRLRVVWLKSGALLSMVVEGREDYFDSLSRRAPIDVEGPYET